MEEILQFIGGMYQRKQQIKILRSDAETTNFIECTNFSCIHADEANLGGYGSFRFYPIIR